MLVVTYLELASADELRPPSRAPAGARLVQVGSPAPELARFLYATVGDGYRWRSRSGWSLDQWAGEVARSGTELWLAWQHGHVTGYVELQGGQHDDRASTNIKYLGLFPDHRGRGLGAHLLTEATRRARTLHLRVPVLPPVERVVVDTRSTDDVSALPNYQERGFRIVGTTELDDGIPMTRLPRRVETSS